MVVAAQATVRDVGRRALRGKDLVVRIAYFVTEFPKVTETFIQRELVEYARRGHEVRLYHLTAFNRREVVHDFARPTLEWARGSPYLFGRLVLSALVRTAVRRPGVLVGLIRDLLWGYRVAPVWLLKSIFILPKCLAFAEAIAGWPADHVHAGFATHPATAAWIVGRLHGIPYSVSCHAHDIFLTQALLDRKLGEAAWVRCISRYNRRFLLDHVAGLEPDKLVVNHVGLWTERLQAKAPRESDLFVILYVGSLESRKGVDVLLRALASAAARLEPWRAIILGGGPERGRLEALVERLGLQKRVELKGAQPVEDVEQARAEVDVQVVPSIVGRNGRTEGLPTVLVEALGCGLPVIASSVTGVPELVVEGETGFLVPPGDEQALADALLRVRADLGYARRLALNGRQRVLAEFDLARNVDAQLRLFARHARRGTPRLAEGP